MDIGGGATVYTGNMIQYFTAAGFDTVYDVNFATQSGLMRGDVLLNTVHHTAIYLGNGRIVQASSDRGYPQTGDQTGTEIWETGYYDYPWDVVLRYKGGGGTDTAGSYAAGSHGRTFAIETGHKIYIFFIGASEVERNFNKDETVKFRPPGRNAITLFQRSKQTGYGIAIH